MAPTLQILERVLCFEFRPGQSAASFIIIRSNPHSRNQTRLFLQGVSRNRRFQPLGSVFRDQRFRRDDAPKPEPPWKFPAGLLRASQLERVCPQPGGAGSPPSFPSNGVYLRWAVYTWFGYDWHFLGRCGVKFISLSIFCTSWL
jgi:hypothetical protein